MNGIFKIAIIVAALIAASIFWPVHEWMQALIVWVKASGPWGVAAFAVIYIAAVVLFLPGSILTLGAGFVYGPFWGTLLVSPVSVTAAFVAFSLARGRLRPWVMNKVGHNERFSLVDKAVGDQGFKIVMLLRLSPLFPFSFLNYALGLTGVKARSYVLASFIGMLPATFLYTYLGSLVTSVTELANAPKQGAEDAQSIFMWVGFAVTVVVTAYVTTLARRALRDAVPQEEGEQT
ncbi:MAG: TVP38/TMEM64 family protein [Emcibacter sp.]|nr:TVP38/TMEM64 family protein [Emcibacter sp.]